MMYVTMLASMVMLMLGKVLVVKKMSLPWWWGVAPGYGDFMIFRHIGVEMGFILGAALGSVGGLSFLIDGICIFGILFTLLGLAVMFWCNRELSDRFGIKFPFAIGLTLAPMVFYPILAFGKAEFNPVMRTRSHPANGNT